MRCKEVRSNTNLKNIRTMVRDWFCHLLALIGHFPGPGTQMCAEHGRLLRYMGRRAAWDVEEEQGRLKAFGYTRI
jgi:hypothetical protein